MGHIFRMEDPALAYIRHVLEVKEWTAADLARETGLSHSTINRPLTTPDWPNQISRKTLAAIQKASGIDPAPFIPERGSFLPVPLKYSEADVQIPRYKVEASAGSGVVVDDEMIIDRLSFPPHYIQKTLKANPRDLAIISVNGTSMLKTLKHGDIVMVDASKDNPTYDGMFVVRTDDILRVKRIQRPLVDGFITITSDNKDGNPDETWPTDRIKIIGRVIWVGGTA